MDGFNTAASAIAPELLSKYARELIERVRTRLLAVVAADRPQQFPARDERSWIAEKKQEKRLLGASQIPEQDVQVLRRENRNDLVYHAPGRDAIAP